MSRIRNLAAVAISIVALGFASLAFAEATVQVEIRTEDGSIRDGRVTLTPRGEGRSFQCTTQNNQCQISGVPGGLYTATFSPSSGPPSSRPVAVGDSGTVRLVIPAR